MKSDKQNRNRLIDSENRLTAGGVEALGHPVKKMKGLGKKENKKPHRHRQLMLITKGKGGGSR